MNPKSKSWLDRPVFLAFPNFSIEHLIIILLLVLTVVSRLADLGLRVMSHDEVNHVVPAWGLYQGQGYVHDPITHGPLQFPLMALSFFLFGASDFTARLPHALFSIATVVFAIFAMRRFLGRGGSLVAGFLYLVSPFFLFYGRYARNEAIIGFLGLVLIFAILAYLESGKSRYLILLTVAMVLHFTSKETAYIYTAQALLFCFFYLVVQVAGMQWKKPYRKITFLFSIVEVVLFTTAAAYLYSSAHAAATLNQVNAETPATVTVISVISGAPLLNRIVMLVLAGLSIPGLFGMVYSLISGFGLRRLARLRVFDLLILQGTLVLPILAAFFLKALGFDPLDYSQAGILRTSIVVAVLVILSAAIGLTWKQRDWLICAGTFAAIFVLFYTTLFTNGQGIATGVVGSLGYWLSQQGVERGGQPWYYFLAIQLPLYEFLPIVGALIAIGIGIKRWLWSSKPGNPFDNPEEEVAPPEDISSGVQYEIEEPSGDKLQAPPTLAFFLFWSLTSLVAFSLAGEKMPWLTLHIALGLILTASFGFGYLFHTFDPDAFQAKKGWLLLVFTITGLVSLGMLIANLFSSIPPFQGKSLEQLSSTGVFLSALIFLGASIYLLIHFSGDWTSSQLKRLFLLTLAGLLAILTVRASFRASFINFDNAKEFLVYAHAARGPKDILEQIQEISFRTTGGKDIKVAYDNDGLYPYWWYLRDYPNHFFYGEKPNRDLREYPLIIVSESNYGTAEALFGSSYVKIDYTRLWWPMMDYYYLTWTKVWDDFKNPAMRSALFQIWLNRDYSQYAQVTNNTTLTLENWQPSNHFRLYIRKDVVDLMWQYGVKTAETTETTAPYEAGQVILNADTVVGQPGGEAGNFNQPRGVAVAPDGSIYVADTGNNRIEHFSATGELINVWGSYADVGTGSAPGGTFYNPWGVAVGPDGSVYVADTWNYRIEKFTSAGTFVTMWGYSGQADSPEAFWGPRAVAVDGNGHVYVVDTGNKRVVVFDSDGNFITEFGSAGYDSGQFDEPVGIAIDAAGRVYVADTWNQRIQVFEPDGSGTSFTPVAKWDVSAWYGQSLDNKPYLTLDAQGHVFITDPDGYRVIEFNSDGSFVRYWGDYGATADMFGMPAGIAADANGGVWVTDTGNHRLMHFTLPVE